MKRLELIRKIENLEVRKGNMEDIYNDAFDYYTKDIFMTLKIEGTMYPQNRQYHEESVEVNRNLFKSYIKSEIAYIEEQITELVGKLK